ncbi:cupin domain-containing protein [Nonomuraea typhae]|uniref:cupin domain-containing protein n=1 Tax=Nonomuraea typhae TaxID=2603600 RepID=UPI0012F9F579|nr:cupin domain-containing protein [Nonomuraea typhae]
MQGLSAARRVVTIDAGPVDVRELKRLLANGARPDNEQFDGDAYLNDVILKPWGCEYRAYADDFFDLWVLRINAPHGTSMHVHPRKLTYLLCLSGKGIIGTFSGTVAVEEGTVLRIAPGVFHSTRNIGDEPLELIEVETPRNKFDLIRYSDDYNRAGTVYESTSHACGQPMLRVPYLPQAKMRQATPDGRFRFEIRAGMDVYYRRRAADVFYIPICVSGAVHSHVEILTGHPEDARRPDIDQFYLCVTRTQCEREDRQP